MKNPRLLSKCSRALLLSGALLATLTTSRAQSLLISTLAGSTGNYNYADGTGSGAAFRNPEGLGIDPSGNLYIADTNNNLIRKVTPAGVVTTLAGAAGVTGSADGTGSAATFNNPRGVVVDSAGNVFVADYGNNTIRKITSAGVVTTVAGTPGTAGNVDATGAAARFTGPWGIALDSAGNFYIGDSSNQTIRKMTPAGVVTTLAGTPGVLGSSDGAATVARFYSPQGVAVDSAGNIYVADSANSTVRKVTPAGAVTTVAGLAGVQGYTDGTGSSARFDRPGAVAIDGGGNLYVADCGGYTIRMVSPSGVVATLAGAAGIWGASDGTGASARFSYFLGITVDPAGDVFVADSNNDTIREGVASGAPTIGTPPLTQSVGVGNTVTFSVAASSATKVSYQWSFNGKAISGATTAKYTTPPVMLNNQGLYTVAVTNSAGTTLSAASLSATFLHDPTYSFGSWTAFTPLPTGTSYTAVAFDGSDFLAVGFDGTAYYSKDGLTWTASASNGLPGQTWGELNSVANVPGQNELIAVGNGGAVVTYASGTYNGSLHSSGSTSILTGVAVGNTSIVAVGFGGTCVTSSLSATSWKSAATGTTQNLNAIAYGNGTFVAVGLGGTVLTSSDGSSWTTQQLGSVDDLYGVAYGERGFVAVGNNGGIFTSPDGTLWLSEISPSSNVLVHVNYGDGVYVAVGFLGTVLTSTDQGATWTSQNSGTGARLDGVNLGNGTFVLTGEGGVVVKSGAAIPSRLVNLSARSTVGSGSNILIAGFVINGTGSKQVLLRGIGPTLGQFGVDQALPQPHLALIGSGSSTLASNSVWGGTSALSQAFTEVGAFPLSAASLDSAVLTGVVAGNYTAQLSGLSNSTGVGLAEIYDADTGATPSARLINISARASVGTGTNVLIAGFVISGDTPEKVLIRGIGPTLSQFGVTGSLATPQLVLYDSGNNTLLANSGWAGDANLSQAFTQVGAFSLAASSADAAILVTLPPGAYTAEVSGVSGSTGVGLAEIYEVR